MKLKLAGKRPEADGVTSFLFTSDQPIKWEAGQFLLYRLPHDGADDRGITRYFTIASAPFEGRVMLTTRFAGHGSSTFKRALLELPIGATVDAGDPDGDFVVGDPDTDHVFIAAGIDITPFRAILLDLDHRRGALDATLLYVNRTPGFVYQAEIDALARRHGNLAVRYLVSPGRLTTATLRPLAARLARPTFYVSGPEPFVEAMGAVLSEVGVAAAQVKRDYFPGYDWP